MKYLPLLLLLTACMHQPNLETGEGCWRTGVAQDNTGRMSETPIDDIPIISVNLEELHAACDKPPPPPVSWKTRGYKEIEGCFQPKTDSIYVLRSSRYSYVVDHEICHVLLGSEHNACYGKGYAQWGNDVESACEWNIEGKDHES